MNPSTVRLQNVFLHVTKACNLRCSYCYFSASKPLPDEMCTTEFSNFWPDLVALKPRKVVFTGGEPLLRDDILTLLSGLRSTDHDQSILSCLNTNGHMVTGALAQSLVGIVDEVRVSIDALEIRNDALRGPGTFAAAIRALETFRTAGFEPKALVTVTAAALADLPDLIALLLDRGINRINVNPVKPIGRATGRGDLCVDREVVSRIVADAMRARGLNREVGTGDSTSQRHCGVGHFINILPNGDVYPCHVLVNSEFRCGNVRYESLVNMCSVNGLLGALTTLDFEELAKQDRAIQPLTVPHACMGDVFAASKSHLIWPTNLPLKPRTRLASSDPAGAES